MAHNIWNQNGRDSMFCVGGREAAWHKLGARTPDAVSWEQAMELANLNWQVKKMQLSGPFGLVDAYGIFRDTDNAFLGSVGDVYSPIQNKVAFEFVDTLIEAAGSHYESAGALGRGERIWCLARVPEADFQ